MQQVPFEESVPSTIHFAPHPGQYRSQDSYTGITFWADVMIDGVRNISYGGLKQYHITQYVRGRTSMAWVRADDVFTDSPIPAVEVKP